MGRESPAVRSLAGRNIPCTPPRVSDAFGRQLGLATLTDRAHADCHDELRDAISNDLFRSGLRGQREPKGIFSAVLPARYLATRDQLTGRDVPAIVPDARVHVRLAAPYTSRADVRQHGPRGPMLPGADRLMDFKTIHAGCQSYQSARARDGERGGAVAERAHAVNRAYLAAARALDQRFQTGGGVLATLTGFGDVRALVIGNYAEMSDDLHQLRERAAWAASEFWERLGSRTRAEAVSYFSSQLRYSWGVAAARAFARHRLRRVIYVGAERLPRAAQLTGQPTGEWAMASATAFQAAMGWVRGAGAGGIPGPSRG